MTNLDRIRSMSAEELAAWLAGTIDCVACDLYKECHRLRLPCIGMHKRWLEQEATNEKA